MSAPSALSGAMLLYDLKERYHGWPVTISWLASRGTREIDAAIRRLMLTSQPKRTEHLPSAMTRGRENAPTVGSQKTKQSMRCKPQVAANAPPMSDRRDNAEVRRQMLVSKPKRTEHLPPAMLRGRESAPTIGLQTDTQIMRSTPPATANAAPTPDRGDAVERALLTICSRVNGKLAVEVLHRDNAARGRLTEAHRKLTWFFMAIMSLTDILLQHYASILQLGYSTPEQYHKSQQQVGPVQQCDGAIATNTLGGEGAIATDTSSASKARCDRGCTHRRKTYRSEQQNTAPTPPREHSREGAGTILCCRNQE